MPRRRRNALALAVMGLLQERPMHPYEIGRTLRARGQDASVKLRTGSLYDMIAALARDEWIEPIQTNRDGARPERTVYRQTDRGQREFVAWLDEAISMPVPEFPVFLSAVAHVGALGRDRAISALTARSDRLTERIEKVQAQLSEAVGVHQAPRLFMIEVEFALEMLDAERNWVTRVAGQMSSGELPWPTLVDTEDGPTWRDESRGIIPTAATRARRAETGGDKQ